MKNLILFLLLFLPFIGNSQFTWSFEDRYFNIGDTVPVRVFVSGFDSVGAFQYSLEYDSNKLSIRLDTPFTFTGLIPYDAGDFSHGLQAGLSPYFYYPKNHIKTLWADPYVFTYPNGHVYTIWFVAKQSGTVCESIKMLNGILDMPVEAWHQNLITPLDITTRCIPLRWSKRSIRNREDNQNYGIYPNPFTEYITISESCKVQIYNLQGQLLYNTDYMGGTPLFINLPQGIYIIKTNNKTHKLIKT